MYVVSLSYKVDLSEVDKKIEEHISFLDKYYKKGNFIASGRKVPRTGGVILARAESKEVLTTILQEDPFFKLLEFRVSPQKKWQMPIWLSVNASPPSRLIAA